MSRSGKSPESRRLNLESLEGRRLMAGDVTAQLTNGTLDISEAIVAKGGSSDISIVRLSNGSIRVSANPASGGKVNGQAYVDFAGSSTPNLNVNLGDGADKLRVDNMAFNKVDINLGKTNSIVGDNDELTLNGVTTRGSMNITTADGNDSIKVYRSTIGNGVLDQGEAGVDTLSILSGKGADTVTIGDTLNLSKVKGILHINTTSDRLLASDGTPNQTELGDDNVSITNLEATDDILTWLGGGTNTLTMVGVTSGDYISIYGGTGKETVRLRDVTARNAFFAKMGAGNDLLDLNNVHALSAMNLDGGDGIDTLIRTNSGAPSWTQARWE